MRSAGTRGGLVWRRHGLLKETELVDALESIPSAYAQPTGNTPILEQEPEEPPSTSRGNVDWRATAHPRLLSAHRTARTWHGEPRSDAAVQLVVYMQSVTG